MTKFDIGDIVHMPGVPIVVEVLEFGTCDDPGCRIGDNETFRFKDPATGDDDWEHVGSFERVT